MGWGRTGTFLAMYLMAFHGMTAQEAITAVRSKRYWQGTLIEYKAQ
jgi:protein-tyrosine phosphatase